MNQFLVLFYIVSSDHFQKRLLVIFLCLVVKYWEIFH